MNSKPLRRQRKSTEFSFAKKACQDTHNNKKNESMESQCRLHSKGIWDLKNPSDKFTTSEVFFCFFFLT